MIWLDGQLLPRDASVARADDSALASGRGCYTSALWSGGGARFAERHARRLVENAARLALGRLEPAACLEAIRALGSAVFGERAGVVRVQASRDGNRALHLLATARPFDEPRPFWRAISAPFPHPGPMPWGGAKVTGHLPFLLAREAARAAGADDALLFDTAGRLVEGARTNVFVVLHDGTPATPPLSRGAVAGIAREILCERMPELVERDVSLSDLARARELVLANAVRGAVSIVSVDGRRMGSGVPGPAAAHFRALLDAEQ
ncbi:MAG TPA: aminotransferase class IV [Myxococcota bacterium]|nr:aminotransferase class IV [Myxococcota bacterium]